jgi:hypothetical protein
MRIPLTLALMAVGTLQAAELELKPETLKAWDEHVKQATLAMQQRLHGNGPFLRSEGNPDRLARIRGGEIVVWPVSDNCPKRVPSGLIHDWMGAAFIPDVQVEDVLAVVRNYSRYKEVYKPGVLDAKLLKQNGGEDRFSMLLRNLSFFTKTALDSEYDSSYIQVDQRRWYSVSCTTRVQEIENFGQAAERKLPLDQGHGYIWRACSLSQLEERDSGVFVDEEMMALSREIPSAVRWMAGPVIRRVAKETLAVSIERTRIAVGTRARATSVAAKRAGGVEGPAVCGHVAVIGCLR